VGVLLLVWLECSNCYGSCFGGTVTVVGFDVIYGYASCVGGSVAISGAGVIKWLWELCWWECSYW